VFRSRHRLELHAYNVHGLKCVRLYDHYFRVSKRLLDNSLRPGCEEGVV
jgi:hypothetical protein